MRTVSDLKPLDRARTCSPRKVSPLDVFRHDDGYKVWTCLPGVGHLVLGVFPTGDAAWDAVNRVDRYLAAMRRAGASATPKSLTAACD